MIAWFWQLFDVIIMWAVLAVLWVAGHARDIGLWAAAAAAGVAGCLLGVRGADAINRRLGRPAPPPPPPSQLLAWWRARR